MGGAGAGRARPAVGGLTLVARGGRSGRVIEDDFKIMANIHPYVCLYVVCLSVCQSVCLYASWAGQWSLF